MPNSIVSEIRERHIPEDDQGGRFDNRGACRCGAHWPCDAIKAADLIDEMAELMRGQGRNLPYNIGEWLREHGMESE